MLTPRGFGEADDSERWFTRTECIVEPELGAAPRLTVQVRCLHYQARGVEAPGAEGESFVPVETVEVDGIPYVAWDEAVERNIDLAPQRLSPGGETVREEHIEFAGGEEAELIRSADGEVVARTIRRRQPVSARVLIVAGGADGDGRFLKVSVTVENSTPWNGTATQLDAIMGRSLVAAHVVLVVDGGCFVSLLDPPEAAQRAVDGCSNDGAFPVLIGAGDVVLSSPIILDDYPDAVLERGRGLYRGPDTDEIHVLRLPPLMDEEKSPAPESDPAVPPAVGTRHSEEMPSALWERLQQAVRLRLPGRNPRFDRGARGDE